MNKLMVSSIVDDDVDLLVAQLPLQGSREPRCFHGLVIDGIANLNQQINVATTAHIIHSRAK
nr:hypothetical protein [Methyloterricola oryzae]